MKLEKKGEIKRQTCACIIYREVSPFNVTKKKRAKFEINSNDEWFLTYISFLIIIIDVDIEALSTTMFLLHLCELYTPATLHFMGKMNHFIYVHLCIKRNELKDFRKITKTTAEHHQLRSIATKQVHNIVYSLCEPYEIYVYEMNNARATMSTFRQI